MLIRIVFVCLSFIWHIVPAQVKLCSWNLQNFGKSKTDSMIGFIAETVRDCDILAIVEVVAGNGGAQAVARLSDELNRKGSKWDYSVSDPTTGNIYKSERYAFIWKTSVVKKSGDAWLEKKYATEIEREPYFATFRSKEKDFTIAAFHAITKNKQPETEIKFFKFLQEEYPGKKIIYCGDFNCPQSHNVFNPLKTQGYKTALVNQRTSLKQERKDDECLASEFDNIFYPSSIKLLKSGIIGFHEKFPSLRAARKISDHLPVFAEIDVIH